MIKLKNHPDSKKLMVEHRYHKDDLLDKKDIRMYQLPPAQYERTVLTSLAVTRYALIHWSEL